MKIKRSHLVVVALTMAISTAVVVKIFNKDKSVSKEVELSNISLNSITNSNKIYKEGSRGDKVYDYEDNSLKIVNGDLKYLHETGVETDEAKDLFDNLSALKDGSIFRNSKVINIYTEGDVNKGVLYLDTDKYSIILEINENGYEIIFEEENVGWKIINISTSWFLKKG